jgi:hypothetical protein
LQGTTQHNLPTTQLDKQTKMLDTRNSETRTQELHAIETPMGATKQTEKLIEPSTEGDLSEQGSPILSFRHSY